MLTNCPRLTNDIKSTQSSLFIVKIMIVEIKFTGKTLKNEPGVQIVKMDATANDVHSTFVVHGFPTIYWYPKSKSPKKYEGGREVNDFIEFIAKHATDELNGYDRSGNQKAGKEEL